MPRCLFLGVVGGVYGVVNHDANRIPPLPTNRNRPTGNRLLPPAQNQAVAEMDGNEMKSETTPNLINNLAWTLENICLSVVTKVGREVKLNY